MTQFIALILLCVVAQSSGVAYYANSTCPPALALPSNIRVWALPNAYFLAGPPPSGYLVDLLNAIQGMIGIPYTLSAHPELNFGNQLPNGSFAGSLIGALVDNSCDLVGPYVTYTSFRQAVVDFLIPLTEYQLEIVYNPKFGLNKDVQYIMQNTADLAYLQDSKNATLNAIYDNVQAGAPESIVAINDDAGGIAKVATGNFAYIGASILIAPALAVSNVSSQVAVFPSPLGDFFLGMAVQKGSPLRDKLDFTLLKLSEDGVLQGLDRA